LRPGLQAWRSTTKAFTETFITTGVSDVTGLEWAPDGSDRLGPVGLALDGRLPHALNGAKIGAPIAADRERARRPALQAVGSFTRPNAAMGYSGCVSIVLRFDAGKPAESPGREPAPSKWTGLNQVLTCAMVAALFWDEMTWEIPCDSGRIIEYLISRYCGCCRAGARHF